MAAARGRRTRRRRRRPVEITSGRLRRRRVRLRRGGADVGRRDAAVQRRAHLGRKASEREEPNEGVLDVDVLLGRRLDAGAVRDRLDEVRQLGQLNGAIRLAQVGLVTDDDDRGRRRRVSRQ